MHSGRELLEKGLPRRGLPGVPKVGSELMLAKA